MQGTAYLQKETTMAYNSIIFEGDQTDIDKISEAFADGFALDKLYPVPEDVTQPSTWKRAHWGVEEVDDKDIYFNTHKSTRTVKAGVMVGFEAAHPVSNWVKKVAKDYPNIDVHLDVDKSGKEEYESQDFHAGKKVNKQPTLF